MLRLPGQMTIAAVGKLRTSYWLSAQLDYAGRIRRYTDLAIIEVPDLVGSGMPESVAVQREGQRLLSTVSGAGWTVALDVRGKHASSKGLAHYLRHRAGSHAELAFLIGGPVGLSAEVLEATNDRLSLSTLTLPHELARVVLLEQIYRALTILSGEPYHR